MIGAILAGGENRRIPYIKGLLSVGGLTIIERNLNILKDVFEKVVINTNSPEIYFPFGVPLIGDIINERGPMTGIFSILTSTGVDSVFVVACDMPFIKEDLIRYMKDRFKSLSLSGKNMDALVPRFKGRTEPLVGIYTSRVRGRMEDSLKAGIKGLHDFLGEVNTFYIEDEEIKDIDPEGLSFVNINTLEDYERIGGMKCLV
ncbi:MAG: molybdenum cofactor guanylyltransferase [Thermodesulfovibrionales bacterium]